MFVLTKFLIDVLTNFLIAVLIDGLTNLGTYGEY
jgi:hypothetical protein